MAGLDPKEIREKLAEVIAGCNVNAYWCEVDDPQFPAATVLPDPGDKYIDYWETPTETGMAILLLQIRIQVAGQDGPSIAEQINTLLRVGRGADRSIVDAIVANRTLDGLVDDCIPLHASCPNELEGPATIAVQVLVHKIDAEA